MKEKDNKLSTEAVDFILKQLKETDKKTKTDKQIDPEEVIIDLFLEIAKRIKMNY